MSLRETAWRLFAKELNASKHEVKAPDEYSPSYLLSPLGAQMNRVFAVGVVTEISNLASDAEPIWRVKAADPTGIFYASAGKFQPKLVQDICALRQEDYVAIVGKVKTYSPDSRAVYVSIRPETVIKVDRAARDNWLVDTAASLKTRLDYYREAAHMDPPTKEKLLALDIPEHLADGIIKAREVYGDTHTEEAFRNELARVLSVFLEDPLLDAPAVQDERPEPLGEQEKDSMALAEESVLMLIHTLSKKGQKVKIEDIKVQARQLKLKQEEVDEALASILDKGLVFEPELGYIQRV